MTELGEHYFKHNERLFYECPALFNDTLGFPLVRSHASKPGTFLANFARLFIALFAIDEKGQPPFMCRGRVRRALSNVPRAQGAHSCAPAPPLLCREQGVEKRGLWQQAATASGLSGGDEDAAQPVVDEVVVTIGTMASRNRQGRKDPR